MIDLGKITEPIIQKWLMQKIFYAIIFVLLLLIFLLIKITYRKIKTYFKGI